MRIRWTENLIEEELKKAIKILGLERMPTGSELKKIGRNDLHCKISRTKKYSGWAKHLDLPLKSTSTNVGQKFEIFIQELLTEKGFRVERMTTRHPYDLLINGTVKVDVKGSNAYMKETSKINTFRLAKTKPTCDIYICVACDLDKAIERIFVIPSHHVKMTMINLGDESKYNRYINRFDYIEEYSKFFEKVL